MSRIPQDVIDLLNGARFTSSNGLPIRVSLGDLVEQATDINPLDVLTGTANPSVLPGVAANPGDLYLRNAPGADGGELWIKVTDAATGWSMVSVAGAISHGSLLGLGSDDHPQYLLANGTRTVAGSLVVTGTVDGRDVSVDGALLDAIGSQTSQATWTLYVDKGRGDTYTPDGTARRPYKAIMDAVNYVAAHGVLGQDWTLFIVGGQYQENVVLESAGLFSVALEGIGVVGIVPVAGNSIQSTANNANLVKFRMRNIECTRPFTLVGPSAGTCFGDVWLDNCKFVGANGTVTATCVNNLSLSNCYFENSVTLVNVAWFYSAAAEMQGAFSMTCSSLVDAPSGGFNCASLINGVYGLGAATLTKGGTAIGSLTVVGSRMNSSSGTVTIPVGWTVQLYGSFMRGNVVNNGTLQLRSGFVEGTLTGTGTTTRNQKASQVSNDSSVTATTVSDALTALDGGFKVVSVVSSATTVGGAPAEAIANAAVQAGDFVHWSILDGGAGAVKGVSAVAAAGSITFTFSANPSNDTVISYMVARTIP